MPTFDLQELAIVVAVKNLDSTLISPEFLRYSQIVPADWELMGQPIRVPQAVQINFDNSVSIVAQPDRISFIARLGVSTGEPVNIAEVAQRYVETLPNMDYLAVGINAKGHVAFPSDPEAARDYFFGKLLAPGVGQAVGNASARGALQLVYPLEGRRLNLTIAEALLQLPEAESVPVVLFTGNFDYGLQPFSAEERGSKLQQVIQNWQADLATYQDAVSQFMTSASPLVTIG
jgi:hypothetical protein